MKKLCLIIAIIVLSGLKIFSQNLNHVPNVVVLDSMLSIFGLNTVEITFANLSDSTNFLFNIESEIFEIKMNDSTWIPIKSPTARYSWSGRQKYFEMLNQVPIRHFIDLYSLYYNDSLSFQAIMFNGKQIALRYSIDISDMTFTNFKRIISPPIIIKIPPANTDDIAAYNYIMSIKDSIPSLRYLSFFALDYSTEYTVTIYKYCIQHFPNSAIATMCALHYSDWLCQGYGFDHKTNQPNQLIIQSNRSIIMASNIPLLRSRMRFSTRCAD
jgi:hypothetical protein